MAVKGMGREMQKKMGQDEMRVEEGVRDRGFGGES